MPIVRRVSNRSGLTLVEVLVAVSIMSVVLVALGGLMFDVARQTRQSAATTYRAAAIQRAAATLEALPWDSIAGAAGCTSGVSGELPYTKCISVVDSTPRMKIVTLVITPTGPLAVKPDSASVVRHRPRPASPIK